MLNFCAFCGDSVKAKDLRAHAIEHNPNFETVPFEVLESECFEQVREDDIGMDCED